MPIRSREFLLGLGLLVGLSIPVNAQSRPVESPRLKIRDASIRASIPAGATTGVLSVAEQETTYFGGTTWDPVDERWEALQDSCWTFDSGVGSSFTPDAFTNPFKDPTLHTRMEGWIGIDRSYRSYSGDPSKEFRPLVDTDAGWTGPVCVGSGVSPTWGNGSFYAGLLPAEADAQCYAAGQGYGNSWNICIEKTFLLSTVDTVSWSFEYVADVEPGYDYVYALVDTGGAGEDVEVFRFTGTTGLSTETFHLLPGTEMRSTPGTYTLKVCVVSDGSYSDEDGLYPTTCGALTLDNMRVESPGFLEVSGFDNEDGNGWTPAAASPGAGGDWADLRDLSSLPPPLFPCECTISDSVLVFEDLTVGGHGIFQDNLAASPWIELGSFTGTPGKFIQFEGYHQLPILNYIVAMFRVQWSPYVCPTTGQTIAASPFTSDGFQYTFGEAPYCNTTATGPTRIDFSAVVPATATELRISVGMMSICRFFANCTGITNSTPWFDNVKLGVYGNPGAPLLTVRTFDQPQDAFPALGALSATLPGRLDSGNLRVSDPAPYTSLGDSLVVRGGLAGESNGARVDVVFAVRPGPGIDLPRFNAWLGTHPVAGTDLRGEGLTWYAARLDTAETSTQPIIGVWATRYHEDDPNFQGTDQDPDPNDLNPYGLPRKANDIFPDDLFTPGTRVNLFYRTAFVDGGGNPVGPWYELPSPGSTFTPEQNEGTLGYLEWECLPSSLEITGPGSFTHNAILYVDHADGLGAQPGIEAGLDAVLPGTSANSEGTPWDRMDLESPGREGTFGRPASTQYGASFNQISGYTTILWNSGPLRRGTMRDPDAAVLEQYLTGLNGRRLYASGDAFAEGIQAYISTNPGAYAFLTDRCGVDERCRAWREEGCGPPSGAGDDLTGCVRLDPVTGAPVAGTIFRAHNSPGSHLGAGSGCPDLRFFNVLDTTSVPGLLTLPDEAYSTALTPADPGDGAGTRFASVAAEGGALGGSVYRTVVDAVSLDRRRSGDGTCTDPAAVAERLQEVFAWFAGTTTSTERRGGTPSPPTALGAVSPNPLIAGSAATIRFSLASPGRAVIDVFDVAGRRVRRVLEGDQPAGEHEAHWDGTDAASRPVAGGIYFYRLTTGDRSFSRKLVVVH